jgi:hypothetical protein
MDNTDSRFVTSVTWIWSTGIFRNSAHPFDQTRH